MQNIKKNKQINLHLPLNTFVDDVRETREEGYCVGKLSLSLMESLLSIDSVESFSAWGPLYTCCVVYMLTTVLY